MVVRLLALLVVVFALVSQVQAVGTVGAVQYNQCTAAATCTLTWAPVQDAVSYQVVDKTGGFQSTVCTSSSTSCTPTTPLLECTTYTFALIANDGFFVATGPTSNVRLDATGVTTINAPSVTQKSSSILGVSWDRPNPLNSIYQFPSRYDVMVQVKSSSIKTLSKSIIPATPQDRVTVTFLADVTGLKANTTYLISVRATTCASGPPIESPQTEQTTNANVVVVTTPAPDAIAYLNATYQVIGIGLSSFDSEDFRVALASVDVLNVTKSAVSITQTSNAGSSSLLVSYEVNTTVSMQNSMLTRMTEIIDDGSLLTTLKSLSNSYQNATISVKTAPQVTTHAEAVQDSSSSANWKLPVIVVGSVIGVIFLIALVVLMTMMIRMRRRTGPPVIDLGNLSQATMY
eukprot:m.338544 g.338544  ORF g.338544 m.338544 type:complete len:402 (+) comp55735_c0_seq1:75-1280(+)